MNLIGATKGGEKRIIVKRNDCPDVYTDIHARIEELDTNWAKNMFEKYVHDLLGKSVTSSLVDAL